MQDVYGALLQGIARTWAFAVESTLITERASRRVVPDDAEYAKRSLQFRERVDDCRLCRALTGLGCRDENSGCSPSFSRFESGLVALAYGQDGSWSTSMPLIVTTEHITLRFQVHKQTRHDAPSAEP